MNSMPEWQETLWHFVYDNLDLSEFEKWVYTAENLKTLLNSDLYLRLLETNYHDNLQIHELKQALRAWLESSYPLICDCLTWKDYQVIPLGYETSIDVFMDKFEVLKRRTSWINLVRCKSCAQIWYLAIDTREDNYHLQRLTVEDVNKIEAGLWPSTVDDLDAVHPRQEWTSHEPSVNPASKSKPRVSQLGQITFNEKWKLTTRIRGLLEQLVQFGVDIYSTRGGSDYTFLVPSYISREEYDEVERLMKEVGKAVQRKVNYIDWYPHGTKYRIEGPKGT